MNKQLKKRNRQVTSRGIEWCGTSFRVPHPTLPTFPWQLPDGRTVYLLDNGRTSNPIAGCHYGCRWLMPDGSETICYAKRVAEGVARAAYPDGFAPMSSSPSGSIQRKEVYWRLEELGLWENAPASEIFVGSQADVLGPWVESERIDELHTSMRMFIHHRYYLLTKNPARLLDWVWPANAWVGASLPPSKFGKHGLLLGEEVQRRLLNRTIRALRQVSAGVKWLSLEPLSWDPFDELAAVEDLGSVVNWVVIGAATNGAKTYQPDWRWVTRLLWLFDWHKIPVFFKGNLEWLPEWGRWREDKPVDGFMRRMAGPLLPDNLDELLAMDAAARP